jgi:hypothetical protein
METSHHENALGFNKKNKVVQNNVVLLCDLELIIGLPCFLPMLEVVHILFRFVQH